MVEAQIICNVPVMIRDLHLDLHRGEEIWVGEQQARSSKDLRDALAVGKVRVYYRVRDRKQTRRHAPPNFQRMRPTPRVVTAPDPTPVNPVDKTALAEEIKQELMGTIAEEIRKALASQAPQAPQVPLGAAEMAAVMEGVLKRHLVATPTVAVAAPIQGTNKSVEEPLYMPTGIVDKDVKAAISTQAKTQEGLDETARLLREMKRRKT